MMINNNELDTKLKAVLYAAIKTPKKKNMLSKTIIENFDLIQNSIESGVTYAQIAEGLGVNYSHFMTYFYRSKKKIKSNAQLPMKNINAKSDNTRVESYEELRQTPHDFLEQPAKAAPIITAKKMSEGGILQTQPPAQTSHVDGIQKILTPADIRKFANQQIDLSSYTNSNFRKGNNS